MVSDDKTKTYETKVKPGGDGHQEDIAPNIVDSVATRPDRVLEMAQIENAMRQAEAALSALKALVEVGDLGDKKTAPELAIRAAIPSQRTQGHVTATALANSWRKCLEFGDNDGLEELIMLMAAWAGVDGNRAELMVKAVVGSYISKTDESLGGKIKRAAFGNQATE